MDIAITIEIPEDVRQRAEERAAAEGKTLAHVLREHITDYADELEWLEQQEDIRLIDEIEARIARGEERLYSHEEVWAEIEALEAQGELPD